MNGVLSDGNTVIHSRSPLKDLDDIMQIEAEIKELFEGANPGQQLNNACILNIVKL